MQGIAGRVPVTRKLPWFVPTAFAAAATVSVLSPYMALAAGAYGFLAIGYFDKGLDRRKHGILMSVGVLTDLVLVLVLQFEREAVQTAVSLTLSGWQQAHVVCSSVATALYVPLLVSGVLMLRKPALRARFGKWHAPAGTAAFLFRTLGFFLMFSMLNRAQ